MIDNQNHRYIAWKIAYQLLEYSSDCVDLAETHPCGGQYDCLTICMSGIPESNISTVMINIAGSNIMAGKTLIEDYAYRFEQDKAALIDDIYKHALLRQRTTAHEHFGVKFILDLLSFGSNGKALFLINNAWYDDSYDCHISKEAVSFPVYRFKNENNRETHLPWWTISYNYNGKSRTLAICNLKTDTLIMDNGKKYQLNSEEEGLHVMQLLMDKINRKPREISEEFENDLSSGMLTPILAQVHNDDNLSLEIRRGYINIYYRGGNLLRIREKAAAHQYIFEFDIRYIKDENIIKNRILALPNTVNSSMKVNEWVDAFLSIKAAMDSNFATKSKLEKEFQQLVVRENNEGNLSEVSDYLICDVEYQIDNTRFDMVAAKKSLDGKHRISIIEMKYLDSALSGKSGMIDHVRKAYDYLQKHSLQNLKEEMTGILMTKSRLGLIDYVPKKMEFTEEKPEFVFLLANHKPASKALETELNSLVKEDFYIDFSKMADLKIASANFMGYGLFNDCVYSLDEFKTINNTILGILNGRKP